MSASIGTADPPGSGLDGPPVPCRGRCAGMSRGRGREGGGARRPARRAFAPYSRPGRGPSAVSRLRRPERVVGRHNRRVQGQGPARRVRAGGNWEWRGGNGDRNAVVTSLTLSGFWRRSAARGCGAARARRGMRRQRRPGVTVRRRLLAAHVSQRKNRKISWRHGAGGGLEGRAVLRRRQGLQAYEWGPAVHPLPGRIAPPPSGMPWRHPRPGTGALFTAAAGRTATLPQRSSPSALRGGATPQRGAPRHLLLDAAAMGLRIAMLGLKGHPAPLLRRPALRLQGT